MPLFNGAELRAFIEQADYVTVNDYESNLLAERTGWSEQEIAGKVKAYIATRGPHGALIHAEGKTYDVPPAHERRITDPTGCGDAFRAGLIFGIEKGYDWMTIGRMGNLMGALKVEHPGTQNQRFDHREFSEQFRQQFGYALS
jgi:adenosine kinase